MSELSSKPIASSIGSQTNLTADNGDGLRWAASVLKQPQELSQSQLRLNLLKRLERAKFVPNDELWDVAKLLATNIPLADRADQLPAFRQAQELRLEERVAEFSSQFFQCPVEKRVSVYQALTGQSGEFPRSLFRLRAMQKGLEVDLATVRTDEPLVQELAGYAAELFVMHPKARAKRRLEIVADLRSRMKECQRAAKRLMKRHSDIAALAPDLIPPLARHFKLLRMARRKPRPVVIRRQRANVSKSFGGALAALVVLAVSASRLIFNSTDNSISHPTIYPPPSYSQQTIRYSPPTQQEIEQRWQLQRAGEAVGRLLEARRSADGSKNSPSADGRPADAPTGQTWQFLTPQDGMSKSDSNAESPQQPQWSVPGPPHSFLSPASPSTTSPNPQTQDVPRQFWQMFNQPNNPSDGNTR